MHVTVVVFKPSFNELDARLVAEQTEVAGWNSLLRIPSISCTDSFCPMSFKKCVLVNRNANFVMVKDLLNYFKNEGCASNDIVVACVPFSMRILLGYFLI